MNKNPFQIRHQPLKPPQRWLELLFINSANKEEIINQFIGLQALFKRDGSKWVVIDNIDSVDVYAGSFGKLQSVFIGFCSNLNFKKHLGTLPTYGVQEAFFAK